MSELSLQDLAGLEETLRVRVEERFQQIRKQLIDPGMEDVLNVDDVREVVSSLRDQNSSPPNFVLVSSDEEQSPSAQMLDGLRRSMQGEIVPHALRQRDALNSEIEGLRVPLFRCESAAMLYELFKAEGRVVDAFRYFADKESMEVALNEGIANVRRAVSGVAAMLGKARQLNDGEEFLEGAMDMLPPEIREMLGGGRDDATDADDDSQPPSEGDDRNT